MVCPQCYATYPVGSTTCSDCKVPLVDAIDSTDAWDDSEEIVIADEKREMAKKFMRFGLIAVAAVIGAVVLMGRGGGGDTTVIPFVLALVAMYICFGISAFRYAESKGYSGFVGLGCVCLGIIGLVFLLNLRDKIRPARGGKVSILNRRFR